MGGGLAEKLALHPGGGLYKSGNGAAVRDEAPLHRAVPVRVDPVHRPPRPDEVAGHPQLLVGEGGVKAQDDHAAGIAVVCQQE